MFFETLEAQYLEEVRTNVDLPRCEARARLQRELDRRDTSGEAPRAPWHTLGCWAAAARLRLGTGLIGAGLWLAGRRGEIL